MYTADTKAKRVAAAAKKIDELNAKANDLVKALEEAQADMERWQAQHDWLQGMPVVDAKPAKKKTTKPAAAPPEDAP